VMHPQDRIGLIAIAGQLVLLTLTAVAVWA
jgi:hypothetical protein